MPLTIRQIVANAKKYFPTQLFGSQYTKIKRIIGVRECEDDGSVIGFATTYSTHSYNKRKDTWVRKTSPELYETAVVVDKKRKYVELQCSCPDFKYRHEVALHENGASDLVFSNGNEPDFTNPSHKPACCKHCFRLYKTLSDKYPRVFKPDPTLNQLL
jgi:hypothetical protein